MTDPQHARVLTLLFSDAESSTLLAERLGATRARELWAAHDRVARDLLASHDGRELGRADGMLLSFDTAAQAVRFALDYQDAVAALGMRLRIGIHAGPVTLRHNQPTDVARGAAPIEVEGLAVSITSRLMALARGGQTLLSVAARDALGGALPERAHLECHGHYRVKGLDAPLEIHEVGVRGPCPFQPPPDVAKAYRVVRDGARWLPVRDVPHNLVAERDAFVGRSAELRLLATRLAEGARLLTVHGTAGTGKTRTVVHYAWTWLGDWPGGVFFCDLSEARSQDGILLAVASALGVSLGREDPLAHLGRAIAGRGRCLVVLDNFEQVVAHAPATVGRWMDLAADAAFVVTSRELLRLPGEIALSIDPLPIATDAIELFAHRVAARDPRASQHDTERWNADDRAAVAEVVRLLDGLPLAIELAAARSPLFSPAELGMRLRERFTLLAGSKGVAQRQATLEAAIDWSWQLLTATEQAALAQCAVFEGAFTLEAAESVLELDAPPTGTMDVVQALYDKSLLRTWTPAGVARSPTLLGMYLSIRDYAARKLEAAGPAVRDAVESRHAAYYARYGSAAAIEALAQPGGTERRRDLAHALDNVVAACRRAVARGAAGQAIDTYAAAAAALELSGPPALNVSLGGAVLAMGNLPPRTRVRALLSYGTGLRRAGRSAEAERALEEALTCARAEGDARAEMRALSDLVPLRQSQGRFAEARACADNGLALARAMNERRYEGGILNNLGIVDALQGRYADARERFATALALHAAVGDRRSEGVDTVNLANVLRIERKPREAIERFEQALAIHREVGDRRNEGLAVGTLGVLYLQEQRLDDAEQYCLRALDIHREVGHREAEGAILAALGAVLGRRGRFAEARAALARGDAILRAAGDREELALLLCERASVARAEGDETLAREAIAEAEGIVVALELGDDSEPGRRLAALRAQRA